MAGPSATRDAERLAQPAAGLTLVAGFAVPPIAPPPPWPELAPLAQVDRRRRDGRSRFERWLAVGGNPLWWSLIGVVGGLAFCLYLIWAIVLGGAP